jgi:hypothetical protein
LTDGNQSILRRVIYVPAEIVVAVYVIVDGIVGPIFGPLVRWLSGLRLVRRMERAIASLPPYVILALLVVPFGIAELAKVYAVFLMGTGHFKPGMTIFIGAYVVSILVCERIFHAGKARLMTIPWFAALFNWVMAIKDAILAWIVATRVWRFAVRAKARLARDARILRELLLYGRHLVTDMPAEADRRSGVANQPGGAARGSEGSRLRAVHGVALAKAKVRRRARDASASIAPGSGGGAAIANDNLSMPMHPPREAMRPAPSPDAEDPPAWLRGRRRHSR